MKTERQARGGPALAFELLSPPSQFRVLTPQVEATIAPSCHERQFTGPVLDKEHSRVRSPGSLSHELEDQWEEAAYAVLTMSGVAAILLAL